MKKILLTFLVVAGAICSCQREPILDTGPEIVLQIDDQIDAQVTTKTTAVNSLPSSLYWGATTGSGGSQSTKWSSTSASVSSSKISTGHYQSASATTYNYYVSNVSMSIGANTTVSATGGTSGTDVICGYTAGTSSATPSVTLSHIFARTGTLTLSMPAGYTASSATWSIVKSGSLTGTAGTYNLRTGEWSSVSGLTSYTTFTSSSDMYLIPGVYTIKVVMVVNGTNYTQTGNVTLSAGRVNNITATVTNNFAINISVSNISDTMSWGTDLSMINTITRASMNRETANCYVVTEPGYYRIPLYYGNSIVDGNDNLSTAAPAYSSGNINFVNAYNEVMYSGNIKNDLEHYSHSLNMMGGKLIWQTVNGLVNVGSTLLLMDGIAYLCFDVSTSAFAEGSALIGVTKSGSTTEYIWSWLIWIVNGSNQLTTETYTNSSSVAINMLNRTLGATSATGYDGTYYQFGMPYALPPNGTLSYSSVDPNTFTTGSATNIAELITKPYTVSFSASALRNSAGTTYSTMYNNWDATATSTTAKDPVKTVYDPCPPGFSVPRRDAFSYFSTTNKVGNFSNGFYFKKNSSDTSGSFWGAGGRRQSSTTISNRGTYGYYWGAQPYSGYNYSYCLYFYSSQVRSTSYSGYYRYHGYQIRPAVWTQ